MWAEQFAFVLIIIDCDLCQTCTYLYRTTAQVHVLLNTQESVGNKLNKD